MKGFKEAFKSMFHYYNEHGLHENSFYISNMHWIYFIPNQLFMNILHGYKQVRLPYMCYRKWIVITYKSTIGFMRSAHGDKRTLM